MNRPPKFHAKRPCRATAYFNANGTPYLLWRRNVDLYKPAGDLGGNSCRDPRGGDGKRWVSFACSGLFVMDQFEDATFFEIGGFYNGQLDDDLRVGLLPIGSFPDLDMLGGNVRLLLLRI